MQFCLLSIESPVVMKSTLLISPSDHLRPAPLQPASLINTIMIMLLMMMMMELMMMMIMTKLTFQATSVP